VWLSDGPTAYEAPTGPRCVDADRGATSGNGDVVVAEIPRLAKTRGALGGIALAVGGVLLIAATHWGHFG
jgi:hypothetical protein